MSEPRPKDPHETTPKREISAARLAANRANSLRSTGPRTPRGKSASRLNGLVHGLCSEVPVLPGEDPEALRQRLETWIDELGPETDAELRLVESAVHASWRMDRGRGVEAAALTRQIHQVGEQFDLALAAEVDGLADRLADPLVPDPAGIVRKLRQSSHGCRWLLGQWGLLADRLAAWRYVEPTDRYRAIHLLGKHAGDLFEDHTVMRWNVAYLGAWLGHEDANAEQRVGAILGGDRPEGMGPDEFARRVKPMAAALPEMWAGHAAMKAIVGEAMAELAERVELVAAREERDRGLEVRCAAFDASAAGASRLRYEMAHERVLRASLRDLRALQKARADGEVGASGLSGAATSGDAARTEAITSTMTEDERTEAMTEDERTEAMTEDERTEAMTEDDAAEERTEAMTVPGSPRSTSPRGDFRAPTEADVT